MDRLRMVIAGCVIALGIVCTVGGVASAAPYAALVMDARSGAILHEHDADRKLHPASLTKMMTLYLTFEAVTSGQIKLDQRVRISRHAAAQPASKIGLRTGQRVTIRDLIRAAAVKSANDAAVALGEVLGGSEAEFAKMMTEKAKKLGMMNTRFRTASGLTAKGQYSTARDMALMGRALFYDFPQYYNLFSRISTPTMGRTVYNTNRRLLRSYKGADGIKTGFTNAAGFNLVSSAERNGDRVIAVVFGGKSSKSRNARVAELLDLGFKKVPHRAKVVSTAAMAARYGASNAVRVAAVSASPAPMPRPGDSPAVEEKSLLAKAGEAIIPSAQASESPVVYTRLSPKRSPTPLLRPGMSMAAAPIPRPGSPGSDERAALTSEPVDWAVQLGVFSHEETAIAELASAALGDIGGLESAGREVDAFTLSGRPAYRARLTGFDRPTALAACAAIQGHGGDCLTVARAAR
ncbi:serine hydrolase [Pikeienuella sp. HZG-20]|uniref:serine hydrolase n=1 Tax=Paludibacillus litoralis TaxID=3133267 RepID=UPI0030EF5E7A